MDNVPGSEHIDHGAETVIKSDESNDITYEFTTTTFKKTSRLPFSRPFPDGTPFVWFRPWNHERITNEANALELVSQRTTIPVPRLIDHGEYQDGRRFLITEFIEGILLSDIQGCLRPNGQKHTDATSCTLCLKQASSNALEFLEDVVLPQLSNLKSQERGIGGFVMPPSWLHPTDPPWKDKKCWKTLPLTNSDYVFQHGDLSAQNLIMDPKTLQVRALIDWEYAGYFPPGMERWPGTLDATTYNNRYQNLAQPIADFIHQEYLECYDSWEDKAQLDELITSGELPHPGQLKQDRNKDETDVA